MTMKAKITRPDGTIIELDGDAAQVQAALAQLSPAPFLNLASVPSFHAGAATFPMPATIYRTIP